MADIIPQPSIPCKFDIAWVGACGKPTNNGWCTEHEGLVCCVCKGKAVRSCEHTGTLVCGAPLCDTCQHSLDGGGHVTKEIFTKQLDGQRQQQEDMERSRTSPDQRLDENGNPVNLFELLKQDHKGQGYQLETVYFLELEHNLMAFLPAVIHAEKRIIFCLDRGLIIDVWRTLMPRPSKLKSCVFYFHPEKRIGFENVDDNAARERSLQQRMFTREEYNELLRSDPAAISWAPGLFGLRQMTAEEFSQYIDRVAAQP